MLTERPRTTARRGAARGSRVLGDLVPCNPTLAASALRARGSRSVSAACAIAIGRDVVVRRLDARLNVAEPGSLGATRLRVANAHLARTRRQPEAGVHDLARVFHRGVGPM